jgi:hypothetical protein
MARSKTADHLRQRTTVHRLGLQGVHPHRGMPHVRTPPYYPQSNGKLERWHKSLKSECIRTGIPLTRENALRLIQTYVDHDNTVRLHSAIGFVTPTDMLAGRQKEINDTRDHKLAEARRQRQLRVPYEATTMTLESREAKWLLGIGCGLRVIAFFFSRNNGGDAFARAFVTASWLQHPGLSLDFGGPRWPPLHFWLMALFAQIVPNLMLACRLLSLVAGLVSLWLFWKLVSRLYGDWPAVLSLAVFTFYSLHIAYSTTCSSEESFVAFVLGGLLGVFSFRALGKYAALVAGGLSLTAAAAIRFEAWIVILALGLIFLLGQEGRPFLSRGYWKALFAYGLTSGVWPVFWTIHSWLLSGHPFYGFADNRASIPAQLAVNTAHGPLYELALSPGVIMLTLTPVAAAGTLYGLWRSLRDSKNLDFAFLVIFFTVFQFTTIATRGTLALARYTLMLGTLCAALAGYGLVGVGERVFGAWRGRVLAVLTAVLVANLALIVILSEYHGSSRTSSAPFLHSCNSQSTLKRWRTYSGSRSDFPWLQRIALFSCPSETGPIHFHI